MDINFTSIKETSTPGVVEISFTASGDSLVENSENFQIHIFEVMPLRDNWKTSIGIGCLPAHGATNTVSTTELQDGLYFIASVTSQVGMIGQDVNHSIAGSRWFNVPLSLSVEQARAEIEKIHEARETLATQLLIADEAPEGSPEFTAVFYFAGVPLAHAFLLSGAEVYPVDGALGVEGMEAPVVADLGRTFNQDLPFSFSDLVQRDYRAANRLFAVRLFNIRAIEMGKAASFAREFADKIATLIATERGEKPKHCATFVGGSEGYCFYPAIQSYRGNSLAPMFSHEHADLIESYQPIMEKSDYARLLITLLAEAIGERDAAFQYWRCWLILEQIAKKHISSDKLRLFHPDGSQILDRNGKQKKTGGAQSKVYQYLMQNNWRAFDLIMPANDGRSVRIEGTNVASQDSSRQMIPLWDAVGAMYAVRNKVAHEGRVKRAVHPTPDDILAERIASDQPFTHGFLHSMTEWAVWREVEGER